MKIWLEKGYSWLYEDEHLKVGVTSHWHKRKEWKGFSVHLHVYKWLIVLNAVDNFSEYDRIMNRRYSERFRQ